MISKKFKDVCYEFSKRASVPGIDSIILFGSVARGEASKESDLDILVLGEEEAREEVSEITLDLEKEFDVSIELVLEDTLEDLENYFLQQILREGIVLYGPPLIEFEELELKPYSIVSYSLKKLDHSEKMKLRRNLYGYSTKKKYKGKTYESKSEGLLKQIGGEKLGPSVLLVPANKLNLVKGRLERFGAEYEERDIYISLV